MASNRATVAHDDGDSEPGLDSANPGRGWPRGGLESARNNLLFLTREEDSEASDHELVERALLGDRLAQGAIFRKYAPVVLGFATRLLRDRTSADDVVQDVFADALSNLASLRDRSALRSWLLGMTVFRVKRIHRKQSLLRRFGFFSQSEESSLPALVNAAHVGNARLLLRQLDEALEKLPADLKLCWMLRFVEGEALEEIATMCETSLSTVKRRLEDADKRLTKRLGEDFFWDLRGSL